MLWNRSVYVRVPFADSHRMTGCSRFDCTAVNYWSRSISARVSSLAGPSILLAVLHKDFDIQSRQIDNLFYERKVPAPLSFWMFNWSITVEGDDCSVPSISRDHCIMSIYSHRNASILYNECIQWTMTNISWTCFYFHQRKNNNYSIQSVIGSGTTKTRYSRQQWSTHDLNRVETAVSEHLHCCEKQSYRWTLWCIFVLLPFARKSFRQLLRFAAGGETVERMMDRKEDQSFQEPTRTWTHRNLQMMMMINNDLLRKQNVELRKHQCPVVPSVSSCIQGWDEHRNNWACEPSDREWSSWIPARERVEDRMISSRPYSLFLTSTRISNSAKVASKNRTSNSKAFWWSRECKLTI